LVYRFIITAGATVYNLHNAHLLLWLAVITKCQPAQNTFKH